MRGKISTWKAVSIALGAMAASVGLARADTLAMEQHLQVKESLQGKRVAWIPAILGAPLQKQWTVIMKQELEPLGVEVTVHDPNLSQSVQVQMMSALIAEKPDLIVVSNITQGLLARQIKQAQDTGIPVAQIQMGSTVSSDVYIGPDMYEIGIRMATEVGEKCTQPGQNGTVAIIEGETSSAANILEIRGVTETFAAKYPGIEIVAQQAANWNANLAFDQTATILQQNPELCAVIGAWSTMTMGSAKAVEQAGRKGKTMVVTNGEGVREECDYVEQGAFDLVVSYNATRNAYTMVDMIKMMLLYHAKGERTPGELDVILFTPLTTIKQGPEYHKGLCFDPLPLR